jgi:ribosomal protein L17
VASYPLSNDRLQQIATRPRGESQQMAVELLARRGDRVEKDESGITRPTDGAGEDCRPMPHDENADERTARIDNEIAALVEEGLIKPAGCDRLFRAIYVAKGDGSRGEYVTWHGPARTGDIEPSPIQIAIDRATKPLDEKIERLTEEIGKIRALAMEASGAIVVDVARLGEVQTRLEKLIQSVARHEVEARRKLQAYVDRRMEHDEMVYSGRCDDYKKTYVMPMEERIAKLKDTVATLNLQREHGEPLRELYAQHHDFIGELQARVGDLTRKVERSAPVAMEAGRAVVEDAARISRLQDQHNRDVAALHARINAIEARGRDQAPKGEPGATGARLRLSLAGDPQADPKGEIPDAQPGLLQARYLRELQDRLVPLTKHEDGVTVTKHDLGMLIYEITHWRKKAAVAAAVAKTQNDLADQRDRSIAP